MKNLVALIAKAYGWLVCGAGFLKHPFLLIIRLYWGWQMFVSGRGHLLNYADMVQRFHNWGVPFPEINVYISAYSECIFGLLLLVGLASRLITIPLIGNFCVAYATASHDTLVNIFSKPDDFVSDAAFLFLLASVIVFIFGPGVVSLDAFIGWIYRRKCASA
jgi:putative oxidoreductase